MTRLSCRFSPSNLRSDQAASIAAETARHKTVADSGISLKDRVGR